MKERKMNNKGFSLVELIIVIAIMAILIVVLAPQYLKYVEKSRNSTDIQNATEIVTAIQVYAADPDAKPAITTADDKATIEVAAGGTTSANAQINAALASAGISSTDTRCSSRTNWTAYKITVNVAGDGNVSFTYSQTGGTDSNAFSDKMTGKSGS